MSISRSCMLVAVGLAVLLGTPAMADIIGFDNGTNFTANGSATFSDSGLILTNSQTNQKGSAFYDTVQSITGNWVATFIYQATDGNNVCLCDGAAFILQNTAAGASAISASSQAAHTRIMA